MGVAVSASGCGPVKSPVRILHVIDSIGNAGAETLLRTFAEGLDGSHFRTHMCGLRPCTDSLTLPALRELGVPTLVLNQRASYDLPALLGLVRYIHREQIDIIHTHLTAGDIMGRMAGFLTGRPVVSTLHCDRNSFEQEPRRRQLLQRWTARLWCRRIIVVSDNLQKEMADCLGVASSHVVSIPNGVNTDRFGRARLPERIATKRALVGSDGPMITNVARLVPQKAQHHLLTAAQRVLAARPDARFLIVGEGALRADLEAQAARLGIAGGVIFAGFSAKIPEILSASDVFVLSSVSEGLPIALLEAMASGCAPVVTAVGGMDQVVEDGSTGLLVPPGDPDALAGAILRYLRDPHLADRLARAAQEEVRRDYGKRAWVSKLEELYLRELRAAGTPTRSRPTTEGGVARTGD